MVVPALNRPFSLGMLYDCNTESLIVSDGLWDKSTLKELMEETKPHAHHNTECKFSTSDELNKKASLLDISASLKLSFMGGLVNVEGSAKYLDDRVSSDHQERVSLCAKYITGFERIINPARKIDRPQLLDSGRGTHYVAGITYGASVVFVFDKWNSEEKTKRDVEGNVNAIIKAFPNVQIEGSASVDIKEDSEEKKKGFKCTFYGDIQLEKNPVTLDDAVAVFKDLPKLVGEGVPVQVYLEPISWLDSKAERISRQITNDIVDKVDSLFEELEQLSVACGDLLKQVGCMYFPKLANEVAKCKDVIKKQKQKVQLMLKPLLPEVRGDLKPEVEILNLLSTIGASPLSNERIREFINAKKRQVAALTSICKVLPKSVVVVAEPGTFESVALDPMHKYTISYTVSTVCTMNFVDMCMKYLDTGESMEQCDELLKAEHSITFDENISEKMNLLKDFCEANSDSPSSSCKFIVMEAKTAWSESNALNVHAKLQLYEGTKLLSDDFTPVTAPGPITMMESYHDHIDLKWDKSSSGFEEVLYYELLCQPLVSDSEHASPTNVFTDSDAPQFSVPGLTAGMQYTFKCRACVASGSSAWSPVSDLMSTRFLSTPRILRASQKKPGTLNIEWQKPEFVGSGLNFEKLVVYMQLLDQKEWKEVGNTKSFGDSPTSVVSVPVPTKVTASFRIVMNCNKSMNSAPSNICKDMWLLAKEESMKHENDVKKLEELANNLQVWMESSCFESDVAGQLMKLETIASKVPQDFRRQLEGNIYTNYFVQILDFKFMYSAMEEADIKLYLSRILKLAGSTSFNMRSRLEEWMKVKQVFQAHSKSKLVNVVRQQKYKHDTGQIREVLSAIEIYARNESNQFQALLTSGLFKDFFEYLYRKKSIFPNYVVNEIEHYLTNIYEHIGSVPFFFRNELQSAYLKEEFVDVLNFSSLKDLFIFLKSAVDNKKYEDDPEEIMVLYMTARTEMLQVLADQDLVKEKAFFDVLQWTLQQLGLIGRRGAVFTAHALKEFCDKALLHCDEYERHAAKGALILDSFLIRYIIKNIMVYCSSQPGDRRSSKSKADDTFDSLIRPWLSAVNLHVAHLLFKYRQEKPYDFEKILQGVELLLEGNVKGVNMLDRIRIPELSKISPSMISKQPSESPSEFPDDRPFTDRSSEQKFADDEKPDSVTDAVLLDDVILVEDSTINWLQDVDNALDCLGLRDQRNITMWDVMKVSEIQSAVTQKELESLESSSGMDIGASELCLRDLPMLILRKILMMDFTGREKLFDRVKTSTEEVSMTDFLLGGISGGHEMMSKVHPLDALVFVYDACHPLLQQVLLEKMFVCKLAIPLLHRMVCGRYKLCLWSMRSIVTEWTADGEAQERSIVNCSSDVMSVMRIGRPNISKSKVLNSMLYDDIHNTFFDHDCTWGSTQKTISDGMVEAMWYIPSEKDQNEMCNRLMMLNLRGDGLKHDLIVKYVSCISTLVMVLVGEEDLTRAESIAFLKKMVSRCANFLVLLTASSDTVRVAEIGKKLQTVRSSLGPEAFGAIKWEYGFTKDGKKESIADLKSKLRKRFNVTSTSRQKTLRELIMLGKSAEFQFEIDEDDPVIRMTKQHAETVFNEIRALQLKDVKKTKLQIQGVHWKEYSETKKKSFRETDSDQRNNLRRKSIIERNNQLKMLTGIKDDDSRFFRYFREYLVYHACGQNSDGVLYFLQWMKLLLDEHTREHLPAAAKVHRDITRQIREEKRKDVPDLEKLKKLQEKEGASDHVRSESSVGLEHLLREVAQVYECVVEYDDGCDVVDPNRAGYESLPLAAAKLLLSGFPLELMDGDVGNVPLSWVRSVLHHAQTLVGNKKIFILAVLGIQSSGKSTLLNTMFGLKFAVSAGRCTRGIFMQILPVNKSVGFGFDYVLVIDTEGLRSSELQHLHFDHDNELATLVIGLGDLTIMNIKGEDLSEVKNILEIAVSAFLKMKIANEALNLQQSCVFVHQNVSAVNAALKMEHGHQQLQNTLDKMTEAAARQVQNIAIHSFNQVINYDGEKHIWYFSDLWKGDPPMAPANPGYSWCVSGLKAMIMKDASSEKTTYYSFANLAQHVKDLWSGIISEDFLFSFRSCLEIKAYTQLEELSCRLQFKIEQFTSEWVTKKANVRICACTDEGSLDNEFRNLQNEMVTDVEKVGENCLQELENFFDGDDDLRQVTIQWKGERNRGGKLGKLSDFIKECKYKARQSLHKMKDSALLALQRKQKDKVRHEEILEKARKLAETFKDGNPSKELMTKEFNKIWEVWASQYASEERTYERSVDRKIEDLLYNEMNEDHALLKSTLNLTPISGHVSFDKLEHSFGRSGFKNGDLCFPVMSEKNLKGKKLTQKEKLKLERDRNEKCQSDCLNFMNKLFSEIDTELKDLCARNVPFQDVFARQIVQKIKEAIKQKNDLIWSENRSDGCSYTITPRLKVRLMVFTARFMNMCFEKMHADYEKQHGIEAQLIRYRETVFAVFESAVFQTVAEVSAARIFWLSISEWLKCRVVDEVQAVIPSEVKADFGLTKYHLLKEILKDLAMSEAGINQQFEDYMHYIENAASFALSWITKYTNRKYFEASADGSILFQTKCTNMLYLLLVIIQEAFEAASTKVEKDTERSASTVCKERMSTWVMTFCQHVQEKGFVINVSDLDALCAVSAKLFNFNDFKGYIMKQQNEVEASLKLFLSGINESLKWGGESPFQSVLDTLWGCKAQCPFCQEPCRLMLNHETDHMCIQHRPQGIGGQSWMRTRELVTENCNTMLMKPESTKFVCLHRSWNEAYEESMKADLAFLVDATGSMGGYIKTICDDIQAMVDKIVKEQPKVKINLAFVAYRDHCDGGDRIQTLSFTTDISKFKTFVKSVRAMGGGDAPEDVFGGLEEVGKLRWTSTNRILMHFADAPCHGTRFHNFGVTADDYGNYNTEDVRGLKIETLMSTLIDLNLHYTFGKVRSDTDKMIIEFNKAGGNTGFITTKDASYAASITNLVPETVTATLRGQEKNMEDAVNSQLIPLPGAKCRDVWHSYKDYKKCVQDWEIAPEQSDEKTLYWQRFLYHFQDQLKEKYRANMSNVDPMWHDISIKRALESLDNLRG